MTLEKVTLGRTNYDPGRNNYDPGHSFTDLRSLFSRKILTLPQGHYFPCLAPESNDLGSENNDLGSENNDLGLAGLGKF